MNTIKSLLKNNKSWAKNITKQNPDFFSKLSKIQKPKYLWIGCSDSRVPANEITGLLPGELFVHRNVANVVVHTDLNCLSVVQFAVEVLNINEIIVCGHYNCGGVRATLEESRMGLIDNWLRHIADVKDKHKQTLSKIKNKEKKLDKLCELNVLEQAQNLAATTIVQDAWSRKQPLTIHAWIYDLKDGLLKELWSRNSLKKN